MERKPALAGLGLAVAGRSGWTVADEVSRRDWQAGAKPRVLKVRRRAADVRAATAAALAAGAELQPHPVLGPDAPQAATWNIAGRCERPITIEQRGEGHFQAGLRSKPLEAEWQPNRTLTMLVRCRECAACLYARQRRWQLAGSMEWHRAESQGGRSWFGTLTIAPEVRYRLLAQARLRIASQAGGVDPGQATEADGLSEFHETMLRAMPVPEGRKIRRYSCLEDLTPRQQFGELVREAGPLVTNFLKALRKGRAKKGIEGVRFRYLLVVEPHRDWFPHFHVLMHEISPLLPLRKRALDELWDHGFTKWRVAQDERAASYVAKYLGKEAFARVRASLGYGEEFASLFDEQARF